MVTALSELMKRGHRVGLVCRPDAKIISHARGKNIEVITLKFRGDLDPLSIYQMTRILRKRNINIILTNTYKELRICGFAAKLIKVPPLVISRQGIDYPLKNKLHYRFFYNVLTRSIVANSEATKKTLLLNAPWLDPDKIKVIYNGIDPELFDSKSTKSIKGSLGIEEESILIGFIGRLNVQKGIKYLIDAFKLVTDDFKNVHLIIAGTGDLENTIKTAAKNYELTDKIHLLGFRKDVQNIINGIDMLVLPSLWEGFGIVLIEAMAAGKPCIASNISSMPEIVVHNKTGYVIPPKDTENLAKAIINLIQNPSLAKKMGGEGRKLTQKKFSLQKMIDQYEQLFYENIKS